jgi:hypothetical protein
MLALASQHQPLVPQHRHDDGAAVLTRCVCVRGYCVWRLQDSA